MSEPASRAVYRFGRRDGRLPLTLHAPPDTESRRFGAALAEVGRAIVVGDPYGSPVTDPQAPRVRAPPSSRVFAAVQRPSEQRRQAGTARAPRGRHAPQHHPHEIVLLHVVAYPHTWGVRPRHGFASSSWAARRRSTDSVPNALVNMVPIGRPSSFQYNVARARQVRARRSSSSPGSACPRYFLDRCPMKALRLVPPGAVGFETVRYPRRQGRARVDSWRRARHRVVRGKGP